MRRKQIIDKISTYISRFVVEVKSFNAISAYDINIHAESALIPILDLVYDLELVNANSLGNKNHPAIDLFDEKNRIAFQISSTNTLEKVKTTIDRFAYNEFQKRFDRLFIYILTEKQKSYSQAALSDVIPNGFEFDVEKNIIDFTDIMDRINSIQSLERLEQLGRLFEHEFSDTQIKQREKKFKTGYLKNEPEKLYLNILPLELPEKLFIADIAIDDDEALDRMNESLRNRGKRPVRSATTAKLLRQCLTDDEFYLSDFVERKGQLITFRDLTNKHEPLRRYVDLGTITDIQSDLFFESNDDDKRTFVHLLRQTFIEFSKTKGLEWMKKKKLLRFRNNREMPNLKKMKWKGKKEATKTVIFEMMSKKNEEGNSHIICYRSMAFKLSFSNICGKWFVVINPTWSFTNPGGYHPSRFEEDYLSGLKRQETNEAVYYQYRFFGYYLSYFDLFTEAEKYPYLSVGRFTPLNIIPKIEDSKWLPPKEFTPKSELEHQLQFDMELDKTVID
ncbi:MAG: hypothetical protein EOP48_02910 [Sphingobacteriales bacterium]|nr:MAG: hypothetical protein EOP48_02910 [Sphingobacteriales bacterium]